MWRKFSKFMALQPAQQALFVTAWMLLAVAILAVRLRPLKSLLPADNTQPVKPSAEGMIFASSVGDIVGKAACATPWQSTCLVQTLVVHWLLRWRKIPGCLVLGVRKDGVDGELMAHAWLSCGDLIVNGDKDSEGFVPIHSVHWGCGVVSS